MEISRLKTFLYVVQFGSFQKAADKLFLSQRTVSKQISQMEAELNIQLVERGTNNIALTPAGRAFYASAQDVVNNYDHAVSALHDTARQSPHLKVGYFSYFEQQLLQPALLTLAHEKPTINFTIKEESNEHLAQSIANHELDLALSIQYGNTAINLPGLTIQPVYTNTMVMGVSRLSPLSHHHHLQLPDLTTLPILYYSPESSTFLQQSFLASLPTMPYPATIHRVPSAEQMHLLVALNKAFAFYPQGLIHATDSAVCYKPIAGTQQTYSIVALYKKNNQNPLVARLLTELKATTAS